MIAPLLCAIILLGGCKKDDATPESEAPPVSQPPLLGSAELLPKEYEFKRAYIDYTSYDLAGKGTRYTALLNLTGQNILENSVLILHLETERGYSFGRLTKLDIQQYGYFKMSTYYSFNNSDPETAKINGTKLKSSSWIAIVGADGADVKTNRVTIIFSFEDNNTQKYVGQLVLE